LGIKPKWIFNETSQEMRFMCSEYKIIKSQITRNINKRLSSDVIKFDEIPDESKYHKTVRNVIFMIFKNSNLIILQSSFQAQLFTKYNENIFVDGPFYIASKFKYQEFITRTYIKYLNSFYTTFFLKNKKKKTSYL